jgi:hypothetical protein
MVRVPRELSSTPRRWGQIAGVVVFLGVCGLAGALLFRQAGDTTAVLVMRASVPEGQVIERSDLVSGQASGAGDAYRVSELGEVVGSTAAVDLLSGQVLVHGATTTVPVPAPGETLVGMALPPSRIPDGLSPGDTVRAIAVPPASTGEISGALDDPRVLVGQARVFRVAGLATAGGWQRLTLVVPAGSADTVAAHAAADRLAVLEAAAPAAAGVDR